MKVSLISAHLVIPFINSSSGPRIDSPSKQGQSKFRGQEGLKEADNIINDGGFEKSNFAPAGRT